jgi:hypothetical protein
MDDRGRIPGSGGIFLFDTASTAAPGHTIGFLATCYRGLSLPLERPEREADNLPRYTTEIKNAWSFTSTLPIYVLDVVVR